MATNPGNPSPLEAFLSQFWKDREQGSVRGLREYLDLFPGDDEGIGREYFTLLDREAPAGPEGDALGPYRLEEEIGRGGQGVVYRAVDTRIGRTVALKVLRGLGPGEEAVLKRFKREAQAASRTDHPGVCPVYDAQMENGIPYIAMRYVAGETLAVRIATTRERGIAEGPTTVARLDEIELEDDADTTADPSPTPSGPARPVGHHARRTAHREDGASPARRSRGGRHPPGRQAR